MPEGDNDNYKTVGLPFPIKREKDGMEGGFIVVLSIGVLIFLIISFVFVYQKQKHLEPPPDIIFMQSDSIKIFIHNEEIEFEGNNSTQPIRLISLLLNSPGYRLRHEQIKKEFWEHVTESSFKNSLNVTLSTIRKNISPYGNVILNRKGKVCLVGNFKVLMSRN